MGSRNAGGVARGAVVVTVLSLVALGALGEDEPSGANDDPFAAEFVRAYGRASIVLDDIAKEYREMFEKHDARMSGRNVLSYDRVGRWRSSSHDAVYSQIEREKRHLGAVAADWKSARVDPSIHRRPEGRVSGHLGTARWMFDDVVLTEVERLWSMRLAVAREEMSAVAADVQSKLDAARQEWEGVPRPKKDADARERAISDLRRREKDALDDPQVRRDLKSIGEALDARRLPDARRLVEWELFVERNFAAGPQEFRQGELDFLTAFVQGLLRSPGKNPGHRSLDDALGRVVVYVTDPELRDRGPVPLGDRETLLFEAPAFDGDLRKLLPPLKAGPGSSPPPIGHKRVRDWIPDLEPRVYAAVVVRPWQVDGGADRWDPRRDRGVTLCILGVGLIDDDGRVPSVTASSTDVSYTLVRSVKGARSIDEGDALEWVCRDGFNEAVRGVSRSHALALRFMDMLVVNAGVRAGSMPGYRAFSVGEAVGIWTLRAAATSGRLDFVRARPDRPAPQADRPKEFYVLDQFTVQIETADELPVEEVKCVVVGRAGPLALRVSGDDSSDGVLTARKVAGYPRLFRSLPVFVEQPNRGTPEKQVLPGMHYAELAPGERLLALPDGPLFEPAASDVVDILQSPDSIKTVDQGVSRGSLFTEALIDAARLKEVQLESVDTSFDQVIETITHTYVCYLSRHEIKLSLADHAMLLMMKRTFLQMAQEHLDDLVRIRADDDLVRAHVGEIKAAMQREEWSIIEASSRGQRPKHSALWSDAGYSAYELERMPFPAATKLVEEFVAFEGANDGEGLHGRYVTVSRPVLTEAAKRLDGWGVPLLHAFSDGLACVWFCDVDAIQEWQFHATEKVLDLQIKFARRAIRHAHWVDDASTEDLLEFCGRGFDRVIERIMPRLTTLRADPRTSRLQWSPDERVRAILVGLQNTFAEHDLASKAASADTQAVLAIASGPVLWQASCGKAALGAVLNAVAAAAGVVDATVRVGSHLEDAAEAQFAADAMEVIGRDRLKADLRDRDSGAGAYVEMALSIVGFRFDMADAIAAVRLSSAGRTVEDLLKNVMQRGLAAIREAPPEHRALVQTLIFDAAERQAAGRALDSAQRNALEAGRRLEAESAGVRLRTASAVPTPPPGPAVDPRAPGSNSTTNPPTDPTGASTQSRQPAHLPSESEGPIRRFAFRLPEEGYRIEVEGAVYLVGRYINHGAFSTVFELLDGLGKPTGKVVKFLSPRYDDARLLRVWERAAQAQMQGMSTNRLFDNTPLQGVIDRMLHGDGLLRAGNVPHAALELPADSALARLGRDGSPPFVVQELIPNTSDFVIRPPCDPLLEPGMQVAVAKLYRQIADAGLVWLDGHMGNIYFRRAADGWEAGVLDPDLIARFDEPILNPHFSKEIHEVFNLGPAARIRSVDNKEPATRAAASSDIVRRVAGSAHEFMAKMLERWGFIRFCALSPARILSERRLGDFGAGAIEPQVALDVFGDVRPWVRRNRRLLEVAPTRPR